MLQRIPSETNQHFQARADDYIRTMQEFQALTDKAKKTRDERMQWTYLRDRSVALKSGYGPDELNRAALNGYEASRGNPLTHFRPDVYTPEEVREWRGWRDMILGAEHRAPDLTNNPQLLTPGGPASFVPVEWSQLGLLRAMKAHDPFFDPNFCTVIYDEGVPASRPIQIPFLSDIENVATVISESSQESSQAIGALNGVLLGSFTYRTPAETISGEALQDLETGIPAVELLKDVLCDRFARGLAADLVNGSGINRPLGLLPALLTMAQNPIGAIAQSTTSISLQDIEGLYYSVDSAYRNRPKAAWICNDSTAQLISANERIANNARLMSVGPDGRLLLLGKPLYISPSMPSHAPTSQHSVAFGDFEYFVVRLNYGDNQLRVISQAPGYVEKFLFGVKLFARGSGALCFPSDANSNLPIRLLSSGPSA